jgi:hypothetical protein
MKHSRLVSKTSALPDTAANDRIGRRKPGAADTLIADCPDAFHICPKFRVIAAMVKNLFAVKLCRLANWFLPAAGNSVKEKTLGYG